MTTHNSTQGQSTLKFRKLNPEGKCVQQPTHYKAGSFYGVSAADRPGASEESYLLVGLSAFMDLCGGCSRTEKV